MSLLSRPRHVVSVQHFKAAAGSIGQKEYVPDGAPVDVRCNVHLMSSSEVVSFGTRAFIDGTITATSWPWDEHTIITWEGVEYDQDAAAVVKKMSRRTQHFEIGIRKRKVVVP